MTLRTLLVGVLVIGGGGVWLCSGCETSGPRVQSKAEAAARHWAEAMKYPGSGVSCSDSDSDWDGYVSCTVRPEGATPLAIECTYPKESSAGGCKVTQPRLVTQGSN